MSDRALTIEIPGRPPTPNTHGSAGNRMQAARERREWRETATSYAIAARLEWERKHGAKWEPLGSAELSAYFVLPDARRRDLDNLVASLKPLLDGAVDGKLIVDDSIECVCELLVSFGITRGKSATRLTFSEMAP